MQLTASFNGKRIANRELGTIQKINSAGNFELRLDSGEHVFFNLGEHRSLDYGTQSRATAARGRPPGER